MWIEVTWTLHWGNNDFPTPSSFMRRCQHEPEWLNVQLVLQTNWRHVLLMPALQEGILSSRWSRRTPWNASVEFRLQVLRRHIRHTGWAVIAHKVSQRRLRAQMLAVHEKLQRSRASRSPLELASTRRHSAEAEAEAARARLEPPYEFYKQGHGESTASSAQRSG